MNAATEDFKDQIVSQGFATFGTDLFIAHMPESPDLCVALLDVPGFTPEAAYTYERPSIQIRVRGAQGGYTTAYAKIKQIVDYFHGKNNVTWNSTRYIQILQSGSIHHIGTDEKNRPLWTATVDIHRTA